MPDRFLALEIPRPAPGDDRNGGATGYCRGHKASGRSGSCIAAALGCNKMTALGEAPGTDSPARTGLRPTGKGAPLKSEHYGIRCKAEEYSADCLVMRLPTLGLLR